MADWIYETGDSRYGWGAPATFRSRGPPRNPNPFRFGSPLLKAVVMQESKYREMMLEGLLSIAEGENPRSIEMKLEGFLD